MLLLLADLLEGLAAVERNVQECVHRVDPVGILGIGHQLVVVLRAARDVVGSLRPALAAVGGAEGSALVALGLDDRVDHIGVGRRDREPDLAHVDLGQTLGDLAPGGAGIGRLVNRRLRSAVNQRPHVAPALVGRGVEDIRVTRVQVDLVGPGVIGDVEHALPALAAVGGLVDPAVAARAPQRPLRGDIDHVRVPWVDGDHADVLGVVEADVLPVLTAVEALVDSVAERHRTLAVVLTGADPDHVGVCRVEGDAADRVRGLLVENWRPGDPSVDGSPEPS